MAELLPATLRDSHCTETDNEATEMNKTVDLILVGVLLMVGAAEFQTAPNVTAVPARISGEKLQAILAEADDMNRQAMSDLFKQASALSHALLSIQHQVNPYPNFVKHPLIREISSLQERLGKSLQPRQAEDVVEMNELLRKCRNIFQNFAPPDSNQIYVSVSKAITVQRQLEEQINRAKNSILEIERALDKGDLSRANHLFQELSSDALMSQFAPTQHYVEQTQNLRQDLGASASQKEATALAQAPTQDTIARSPALHSPSVSGPAAPQSPTKLMDMSRRENCCSSYQEEIGYCKTWAADRAHVNPTWPHNLQSGGGLAYCPFLIKRADDWCRRMKEEKGNDDDCDGFAPTEQEMQAAKQQMKEDDEKGQRRAEFINSECSALGLSILKSTLDQRSAAEQEADPVCIERKRARDDLAKENAANHARREEAEKSAQAGIARLGLQVGQSQAQVKAKLEAGGFKMPWICGGQMGGAEWIAGCVAYRGNGCPTACVGHFDKITVVFTVYRRVGHVDPDTQITTIVNEKTDKLLQINYEAQ